MKVHLYARFSPRPNAGECESAEHQLSDLREHAQRQGWDIGGEFRDEAVSGADSLEDRPGLMDAITSCKKGDVLLVRSWDRLFRDVNKGMALVAQLRGKGINVQSTTQASSGDPMIAKLIEFIYLWNAEMERELNRARTKRSMLRHQANGRKQSDRIPYGMRHHPDDHEKWLRAKSDWIAEGSKGEFRSHITIRIVPDPDEQMVIKRIVGMYLKGMKLRHIAQALEKKGIPSRSPRGWHHSIVASILRRKGIGREAARPL